MIETNAPQNMVKATIYAIFDEKAGPLPRTFFPESFSQDVVDEITFKSMSFTSMSEGTPKSLAIIPIPTYNLKSLVKNIVFDHPRRRGGKGDCCLALVFDETRDTIFYKYIKQFEQVFEKFGPRFVEVEQGEEDHVKAGVRKLLEAFYGEILSLIADLNKAELSTSPVAFPKTEADDVESKIRYKVVVVGDPEVGKTSMILNFTEKAFRQVYIPTIGVNISEKAVVIKDKRIEFVVWDIAGQAKFVKMRKHFYEGAQALLLVFDLTRPDTFKSMQDWYTDVVKGQRGVIVVALAGNKVDLLSARKVGQEGADMAKELGIQYLETSALDGTNIMETFKYFGEKLLGSNGMI